MKVWPRAVVRVQVGVAALVGILVTGVVLTAGLAPGWLAAGPVLAAAWLGWTLRRFVRRRAVLREPFPASWRRTLERRVPYYRGLGPSARRRFEDDVRIFLAEQTIYGAHGVEVDDETRLLIGASAAMLGHGLPELEWPNVRDIVVYPGSFDEEYHPGKGGPISGMVHAQGPVIFSQQDLRHGFRRAHDGRNVGLHELAHVLDMGTGYADGLPAGLSWMATAPWIELVAKRLERVRQRRYPHVLRDYAGQNEAELFAVAVEVFFERPRELRRRDPELYRMLADYFHQDPATDEPDDAD